MDESTKGELTPLSSVNWLVRGSIGPEPEPVNERCAICNGVGLIQFEKDGYWYSKACKCQDQMKVDLRIRRARIPAGLESATLANFERRTELNDAGEALMLCRRYIEEFIPGKTKTAPMFQGPFGVGKTHLAVAVARELMIDKGVEVRFVDLQHLMQQLRATFNDDSDQTEDRILGDIWRADLVVLDDLGAHRRTGWIEDTIDVLIGKLYNNPRPLLVTTNYQNAPAGKASNGTDLEKAGAKETLGDRIGDRMWSRLQSLSSPVIVLSGPDYRQKQRKR